MGEPGILPREEWVAHSKGVSKVLLEGISQGPEEFRVVASCLQMRVNHQEVARTKHGLVGLASYQGFAGEVNTVEEQHHLDPRTGTQGSVYLRQKNKGGGTLLLLRPRLLRPQLVTIQDLSAPQPLDQQQGLRAL